MDGLRELGTGSSNCTTELERLAEAAATVGYSESLSGTSTVAPFTQSETLTSGSLIPASTHRATASVVPLIQSETLTSDTLIPAPAHQHIHHVRHYTNDRDFQYSEAHVHETDIDVRPTITQKRSLLTISAPPAHVQPAVHYNEDRNMHFIKSEKVSYMTGSLEVPQPIELKLSATPSTVIQCSPPQLNVINLKADSKYAVKDPQNVAISQANELSNLPEAKKLKKNSNSISNSKEFISSIDNDEVKESPEDEVGNPHDGVDIPSGGSMLPCDSCGEQFSSLEMWKLHQMDHSVARRRNGLSLEVKIEMIKRINGGEKQADMAEEYGVKPSTVKSIMKKSSSYLACWKKGMFHPDSKRLKGPKREDIEAALHAWYNQAMLTGAPVSGPILCAKALDFAEKLGHIDFKATHGWLDRFKKRKKIVFGRNLHRKKKKDEGSGSSEVRLGEWQAGILPQVLLEYEPGDIFAVEETGLLYKALPDMAFSLQGDRCPGGIHSRQRITVLLCANMTGTEKFPLLVVGRHNKPASFRYVKSLPVQYVSNPSAWMTSESFGAWLQDIDSWFLQQNRRVVVLASSLPVNEKPPGSLKAVKLVTCPSGYIGPLQYGVVKALKKQYRRSILEILVTILEREKSNKSNHHSDKYNLTLLICLQSLTNAWHNVNEGCINASFTKAGISKFSAWGAPHPREDPVTCSENLTLLDRLRSLGHNKHFITFDEFVHFDDDVQVCNLMNDDDILASITGGASEEDDAINDCEEKQDSEIDGDEGIALSSEYDAPSMNDVEDSLSVIRRHIQYQEGHEEMFRVLDHLEFLIFKEQPDKAVGNVQPNS